MDALAAPFAQAGTPPPNSSARSSPVCCSGAPQVDTRSSDLSEFAHTNAAGASYPLLAARKTSGMDQEERRPLIAPDSCSSILDDRL